MAADPAARRVARMRKWHELIELHGSDDEAHYAVRGTPEWEMTFELYPLGMLDEAREMLAVDLMIEADDRPPVSEGSDEKLDERLEKSRIPYLSFWWILEQRVKRG